MKTTPSLTVLILISVLCANSASATTLVEWPVTSGGNGHFYGITDLASNWTTAEATAVLLAGHLATITSASEQAFVDTTFLVGSFERLPLWIGLTDQATEGTQLWVTGEPLAFINWKSGEPNNSGNEDYVTINWDFSRSQGFKGSWNDTPLDGTSGFGGNTNGPYFGLVEIVPEPALGTLLLCGCSIFLGRRRSLRGSEMVLGKSRVNS